MNRSRRPSAADPGGRPLGIPCPGHSSTTIAGRCYWHHKAAHLLGEDVSLEARQWCGFDLPELEPRWNTDRGWREAEDVLRTVTQDDADYERFRGVRWIIDLGEQTMEMSV